MRASGERLSVERRTLPRNGSEPEFRSRAHRLTHHGGRWLLLAIVAISIYFLFPAAQTASVPLLERGVVAREDVIAEIAFSVPKSTETLRRDQEEAARGVPPVFDYAPAAADSVVAGLRAFFAGVESAVDEAPEGQAQHAVRTVLARNRVPTTLGGVEVLSDPVRRRALRLAAERAVRELYPRGITASGAGRGGASAVRVRGTLAGERLVSADSLMSPDAFFRSAAAYLPPEAGVDAAEMQRLLLVRYFQPSLLENERETAAARERAAGAVDAVKEQVLAGQRIIGAREQVGEREEERLRAYQAALQEAGLAQDGLLQRLPRMIGAVLFNGLLLLVVGCVLWLSRPMVYHDDRSILFLALLVLLVAGIAAPIARFGLPPELIPIPFAALVVAVIWGGRLALVVALTLALLLGGQGPFVGVTVPFEAAIGGAAAAFGVRVARRRLQTWGVIGIISAAYAMGVLALGLLRARGAVEIGEGMMWGTVNGIASTLLAIGVLPLAEWFTRVTTNQTLMELADPKHPLLQRLSLEAPGTYAHTISVANLAEAVCNAIGANALLARVGVYYHDIGKISKPQYFIENQPRGRNPHDKLKPSMSAAIVRSHVVEGLRLANEYGLPDSVKAFIAQHHGTQSISFFLEQARASDPEARVNPAEFAYGGPRPQTRETAVVMMADSVESAARVLQDPTPQRIRELVDRIVAAKVEAGQLDESPLTLRELTITKDVLVKVLNGMYHQRLDYPPAPVRAAPAEPAGDAAPAAALAPPRTAAAAAEPAPVPSPHGAADG